MDCVSPERRHVGFRVPLGMSQAEMEGASGVLPSLGCPNI